MTGLVSRGRLPVSRRQTLERSTQLFGFSMQNMRGPACFFWYCTIVAFNTKFLWWHSRLCIISHQSTLCELVSARRQSLVRRWSGNVRLQVPKSKTDIPTYDLGNLGAIWGSRSYLGAIWGSRAIFTNCKMYFSGTACSRKASPSCAGYWRNGKCL
jgi:hypothetical protein